MSNLPPGVSSTNAHFNYEDAPESQSEVIEVDIHDEDCDFLYTVYAVVTEIAHENRVIVHDIKPQLLTRDDVNTFLELVRADYFSGDITCLDGCDKPYEDQALNQNAA